MEMPENLTELEEGAGGDPDKENAPSNLTSSDEEVNPRAPKVFMLSSVTEEDKEVFAKFLEAKTANGKYSNTNSCDPEATHIVAQKLGR